MLRRSAVPIMLALSLVAVAPAQAETTSHVFSSGSTFYPGDTTQVIALPLIHLQGNDMALTNLDPIDDHALTSVAFKPGSWYERLFTTQPTTFLETEIVVGVAGLAPGRYPFFCSIHTNMQGAFDVV